MNDYINNNKTSSIHSRKGFSIFPYFQVFIETFEKSANRSFANFFKEHSQATKWMVYSDYIIGDKNKNSDVITFTFAPYLSGLSEFEKAVDSLSFKDVKHLSRVNQEFLEFTRHSPTLSVSVMLNRNRKIAYNESEKEAILRAFDGLQEMVRDWQENEPDSPAKYRSLTKDFMFIRRELKQNKINVRLIRDIYIVASIAAYLTFEVTKTIDVEVMGWFSDRDNMLSYKSSQLDTPTIFRLTHILYHVFCENKGVDSKNNPIFGIPEKEGKVWYDALLRIPDIICATLADLDFNTEKFSHEKFWPVLDTLFVSNEKILILELNLLKDSNTAVRRTFNKNDSGTYSAPAVTE